MASDMRFQRILGGDEDQVARMGVGTLDTISQDRLGFMWFGGENALLRFDGAEFRRYEPSDEPGALPSNAIRAIVVDQTHEMWIGTDIGLILYSDHSDQFTVFRGENNQPESLPSTVVTALAVDKKNNLIIGTSNGVTILDRNRKIFIPLPLGENAEPNKRHVFSLFVDSKNRLWVGTQSAGLFLFSVERELIRHYAKDAADPQALRSNSVSSIAEDRLGRVWVGTFGGGVSRMNEGERTLTNYFTDPHDPASLQSNIVTKVFLDSDDNMWVGTDQGGLALFNPEHDDFTHYTHSAYDKNSLPTNQVRTIAEDREGNLWVSTFPGNISFYDRSHANVTNYTHKQDVPESLSHPGVLSFLRSADGMLWVGTENGLNLFNLDTKKVVKKYKVDPDDPLGLSANAVLALEEDVNGDIWIGTWAGGLQRLSADRQAMTYYQPNRGQPNALADGFVWSLMLDSQNDLWIGTETGGLARYNRLTDNFETFRNIPGDTSSIASNFVQDMLEDSRGTFWVATTGGLNIFDRNTSTFKHLGTDTNDPKGIRSWRITSLMEDSEGNIWVGTQGDGIFIYDYQTDSFSPVLVPRADITRISSFVEDNQHFIWAGTTTGIFRIDPSTQSVLTFGRHHGLVGNNFNRDAVYKDPKGNLYFGGTDGISVFDPRLLVRPSDDYSLVITDFRIFNQSVSIDSENSPLTRAIAYTDSITLEHFQKVFTFTFSALDYRSMGKNRYAYTLEGFDNDWYFVDDRNHATYTNLSPGEYLFRVKGADRDDNWGQRAAEVKVIIKPSAWFTWWAFCLYACLVFLFIRSIINGYRHHMEDKNKQVIKDEIAQLNEAKDTFIKNTSYEFYQPVRDIVRLGESIISENKDKLNYSVAQKIKSIINRGNNLASIIYEIQDFGQFNDAAVEPQYSAIDLKQLVQEIFDEHETLAQQKNIRMVNAVDDITPNIWADRTYLAQALSILVTSAMQDLSDGVVTIRAIVLVQKVQIEVEDTGSGIAQETYQALFGSGVETAVKSGAGVIAQLTQVKHLIELQGSALTCRSRWAEADSKNSFGLGAGTCFSFIMSWAEEFATDKSNTSGQLNTTERTNKSALTKDIPEFSLLKPDEAKEKEQQPISNEAQKPIADAEEPRMTSDFNEESSSDKQADAPNIPEAVESDPAESTNKDDETPASKQTVLVVDDDPINRMVLSGMLGMMDYQLLEVSSGPEALDLILEKKTAIDLVLLDVMMPRMTGFEVCQRLREHFDKQALPVLFLTAKHDEQDATKAREVGGNEVLHKPVKKDILLENVKKYLDERAGQALKNQAV